MLVHLLTHPMFPLFGLLAPIFFLQICLLILSRLGGWHELARAFPVKPFFQGETWRFKGFRINSWCAYNNMVTMTANFEGVQFFMPLLFRSGHDPIFIPWTEMKTSNDLLLFGLLAVVKIDLKSSPSNTLWMAKSLFEEIRNASLKKSSGDSLEWH